MRLKKLMAMGLSMVMALGLAGCGAKEAGTVKLGLITPKTGQVAQYGIAVENAVKIAVEEVNAAGGVGGKQVELISYDNKADATESINVFNRLVDNDKIVALVGPVISSTSLAVAPLAEEKQIPMISPTATNLAVTPDYKYVFRACYTDPYQGGIVAKFASENLGAKTAAILYNAGDDYSTGLAEAFKATFEAAGGTITNYEGYTAENKDFKSVLTTIKEKQPDVLFNPDYYNSVGLIAGQVKEVGLQTVMLGGDGWDDVQKDYAGVVDGYFFANHYATDDEDATVQNFIKAYQDKYEGNTPNALGALGYDAAKIMMAAIEKAGSTEGAKILAALQATNLGGVTGQITFDENGDPQKSVSMIKIENGALKLEAKVGQ
ncbi:ABC transporter substrate-binding protein [Cellulosilyticum sp. I15G10I2]|uniref:ABC transporter substrate-binding protein n=1 Tax=Cellulosilyticum sp. I15G10I2 TaxID=1892843 RepID=UPI00085CC404|nr:ABC transporter substrate-binding protein [Cellulosilyticum sp. I15G10I2]